MRPGLCGDARGNAEAVAQTLGSARIILAGIPDGCSTRSGLLAAAQGNRTTAITQGDCGGRAAAATRRTGCPAGRGRPAECPCLRLQQRNPDAARGKVAPFRHFGRLCRHVRGTGVIASGTGAAPLVGLRLSRSPVGANCPGPAPPRPPRCQAPTSPSPGVTAGATADGIHGTGISGGADAPARGPDPGATGGTFSARGSEGLHAGAFEDRPARSLGPAAPSDPAAGALAGSRAQLRRTPRRLAACRSRRRPAGRQRRFLSGARAARAGPRAVPCRPAGKGAARMRAGVPGQRPVHHGPLQRAGRSPPGRRPSGMSWSLAAAATGLRGSRRCWRDRIAHRVFGGDLPFEIERRRERTRELGFAVPARVCRPVPLPERPGQAVTGFAVPFAFGGHAGRRRYLENCATAARARRSPRSSVRAAVTSPDSASGSGRAARAPQANGGTRPRPSSPRRPDAP